MSFIDDMLNAAYDMRSDIVPMLLGDPGIGKTQAVYRLARNKGVKVVEIIASQILPNEVSGITMPVNDTHSMEVFDHVRLSSLEDGDILFFDELYQAPKSVLSACLTLIQERRMMSGRMLPDVFIVAASNPPASPSMIDLPVRDRFQTIMVEWDRWDFYNYIKDEFGVTLSDSILDKVKKTGNDWNVLTPRTLTKFIKWYKERPEHKTIISDMMMQMYEDAELVLQMEKIMKPTASECIGSIAEKHGVDLDGIDIKEAEELLETLMSLPEWEEIEKDLDSINEEDFNV